MTSSEHMDVFLTRTVHIEKSWAFDEFTTTASGSSSPNLFLENDWSKRLQLSWYRDENDNKECFIFDLLIAIKGRWVCRGECQTVRMYCYEECEYDYEDPSFEDPEYGDVVYSSSVGGFTTVTILKAFNPWDTVKITFTFFLNQDPKKATVDKEFLTMTSDDVCGKLLTEKGPCSFILKVEGKEITVHGCVLAIHSEVFKRMIEQDGFREGREKVVEIADSDYDSVMAMVRFMHGFSDGARDHAEGVLALADKYAVEPLKEFAVVTLKERISHSTVVDIATMAFMHTLPTLFEECRVYIALNFLAVSATAAWKHLRDTNGELLLKLV